MDVDIAGDYEFSVAVDRFTFGKLTADFSVRDVNVALDKRTFFRIEHACARQFQFQFRSPFQSDITKVYYILCRFSIFPHYFIIYFAFSDAPVTRGCLHSVAFAHSEGNIMLDVLFYR